MSESHAEHEPAQAGAVLGNEPLMELLVFEEGVLHARFHGFSVLALSLIALLSFVVLGFVAFGGATGFMVVRYIMAGEKWGAVILGVVFIMGCVVLVSKLGRGLIDAIGFLFFTREFVIERGKATIRLREWFRNAQVDYPTLENLCCVVWPLANASGERHAVMLHALDSRAPALKLAESESESDARTFVNELKNKVQLSERDAAEILAEIVHA